MDAKKKYTNPLSTDLIFKIVTLTRRGKTKGEKSLTPYMA